MTMRSPVLAILWESWRVTRIEAAWRLGGGIVAAAAVLILSTVVARSDESKTFAAAVAVLVLIAPNLVGWLSFERLTGGRPGFPLPLLYTRPVRTAVVVGVPMAYRSVAAAAIYVGSALLLRGIFGLPFPLLAVAAWIAVLNVLLTAGSWWSRNKVIQILCVVAASLAWMRVGRAPLHGEIDFYDSTSAWPTIFDVSLVSYAWMGVLCLASFGLTVVAVERQRHGSGGASTVCSGVGLSDSLISLFRSPCPTASATRAQIWFELRSRGLPVLTIGVALALVNLVLYTASGPIDALINAEFRQYLDCSRPECYYARPMAMLFSMMSVPVVLGFGGNGFGILARQGRAYVSPFEATQPYGTGRLAVLKVLVRSASVLAALTILVGSLWASGSLKRAGEIFGDPLLSAQRALEGAPAALTRYDLLALAVVGAIGVALMVTSRAALGALWTRYPRRLNIAGSLLLIYGVGLVLLALAAQRWSVPLGAILRGLSWVAMSTILCATLYLVWRTFAERLLTLPEACGIVLLSVIFAAAWLTLLSAAGLSLTGMPGADVVRILSPALLLLMISVLAPWSYSRVRHT